MQNRRFFLLSSTGLLAKNTAPEPYQFDLFQQGTHGVHTYRIPALLETNNGTLIAIADARHENSRDLPGKISLVMRRSHDHGLTWQAPITIRAVAEGGVGDPSLLLDKSTGRIWCFHAYGPPGIGFHTGSSTLQLHAMFSDDHGATWSKPIDLTPQIHTSTMKSMFATSGTHIQTRAGRFLVTMVVKDHNNVVAASNAYSDDHGISWKLGPTIGPGSDESHAVELKNGTILQNIRNGNHRTIAWSKDGGITFTGYTHDEALLDPGCNAGITRWKNLLIFTNAASAKRENLTVKYSKDEGRTWSPGRTLHHGPAAYSTVIPLRDGTCGVLYEGGEQHAAERITFARLTSNWMLSK